MSAILWGCKPVSSQGDEKPKTLTEARRGFQTRLIRKEHENEPAPQPPANLFRLVHYRSPAGELPAYVGVDPGDHARHAAIIWLVGGFSNSIDSVAWERARPENDQSASAFREAGLVMMYPGLRGGNDHPGFKEGQFGEVDDVLAAADYLAKIDYVDPKRIYLGGHSTGGTLALMVAESTSLFRAVFSFGPVPVVSIYGQDVLPFDVKNEQEIILRAPMLYLKAITSPTFAFEGDSGDSNIKALRLLAEKPHPDWVHFQEIKNANHFSTLAPITRIIARKILADQDAKPNLEFTQEELTLPTRKAAQ